MLSVTAVVSDIALKLGVVRETLRQWYMQIQIDAGRKPDATSEENVEIKRLRKEHAELRRTNEILKLVLVFRLRT